MSLPTRRVHVTLTLLYCASCSGQNTDSSKQEVTQTMSGSVTSVDNPSHDFKTSFGYIVRPIPADAEVVAAAVPPTYNGIVCRPPATPPGKNGAWYFEFLPGDFQMGEIKGKLMPVWVPKLEAASSDYRVGYWVFEHRGQLRVGLWATGGVQAGGRAGPAAMNEDVKHRFGGFCG